MENLSYDELINSLKSGISPDIGCRFDWFPGHRFALLECVLHRHEDESPYVFVRLKPRRDELRELAKSGLLVGQAAADAERTN